MTDTTPGQERPARLSEDRERRIRDEHLIEHDTDTDSEGRAIEVSFCVSCDDDWPCVPAELLAEIDVLRSDRDAWKARAERLVEQLRIATELLEKLSSQRGLDMRYPGEHATLAEDALLRISVVEGPSEALAEPQPPCPGYVPTGHVCERCGEAPENHSHERHVIRGEPQPPAEPTDGHPWFAWLPPSGSVHRQCCDRPQSEHPEGDIVLTLDQAGAALVEAMNEVVERGLDVVDCLENHDQSEYEQRVIARDAGRILRASIDAWRRARGLDGKGAE